MGVFDGMEHKFTVVKTEDIKGILTLEEQAELSRLLRKIDEKRFRMGRSINVYLVINIDEPYAPDVVEIMKANGHWGTHDPNQVEAIFDGNTLKLPAYNLGD